MICSRCLYPSTKPDLHFDEEGVCSACRSHERRTKTDWTARQRDLETILETGRNGSGYDCIVPSSGGKDSHWQVLKLIELGARPLVVTATTCHLTDIGRANIDNLARYATTIEVTANRAVRAKLNRLGLTLVGDISWPEHAGIFSVPFRVARETGIPLVFYGECSQEAYGGPPGTDAAREMTLRWVQEFGGLLGFRPSDFVGQEGITAADMADYTPPEDLGDVTAYFLGQFYEWDSHRNAAVAMAHGMKTRRPCQANWWFFENLDNAQTGIHDYLCFLKYGYGRLVAQMSVDIRNGLLSREVAERELWRDGTYPDVYMGVSIEDVLGRIGLTRLDFGTICRQFRCSRAA